MRRRYVKPAAESPRTDGHKLAREIFGLFLLFWGVLIFLSLLSFDANDPSLNHVVSGKVAVNNRAGLFGAYLAGFLTDIFGVTAFLWPVIFGVLGGGYVFLAVEILWWRWCGYFLLTLCLLTAGAAWDLGLGDVRGGGMIGQTLYATTCQYFSPGGAALIWGFILFIGSRLSFDIPWVDFLRRIWNFFKIRLNIVHLPRPNLPKFVLPNITLPDFAAWRRAFRTKCSAADHDKASFPEIRVDPPEAQLPALQDDPFPSMETTVDVPVSVVEDGKTSPLTAPDASVPSQEDDKPVEEKPVAATSSVAASPARSGKSRVPFPPLDLLALPKPNPSGSSQEDMNAKGNVLMGCLEEFNAPGELVHITPGPVVTMFEVRPAPGIRVSRIAALSDDLSLALKAVAVRIQAPIPGTDTVGIEIPNAVRENVSFRALLEDDSFRKSGGPLTMALGKDISGRPVAADLSRMPHLLVAGATGAGKSVCLNAILISLLYTSDPEELQLLLVDPKRIELAVYKDLPHLVHPVVTEMSQAKTALEWAVHEMDHRYEVIARLGVRNISGYNQKLQSYGGQLPEELADLEHLPYLVIIIDELADLMLTAGREVETSIVRLAQLARAAGIHMILATQRPSVDVVTGLIKANFPCRISFQVTSKVDSRTILDMVGAEHLLGKGDMLFKPSGGRLQRLHGPFVTDEEVAAVVGYWKRQLPPSYRVDFAEWGSEAAIANAGSTGGDASQDPLYAEVQKFVDDQGKASISLVQRRFKIGFNRAARLVEQLERDGIIGPADGSKPRPVVR